jgi:hypothetical protein
LINNDDHAPNTQRRALSLKVSVFVYLVGFSLSGGDRALSFFVAGGNFSSLSFFVLIVFSVNQDE